MTVDDTAHHLPVPTQLPGPAEIKRMALDGLEHQIAEIAVTPVVLPDGRTMTVAAAQQWADAQGTDIACAEAAGSLRHRTVPRVLRVVTFLLVGVVDAPIMLWLASSVFNVDPFDPWGVPLAVSVVVAVLATAGSAAALHHIGHELRDHKNDQRGLDRRTLPVSARLGVVAVSMIVATVAAVMFVRVWTEGALSGLDGLAVLLASLVALVMLVTSALLAWTSFRDGSPELDRLRQINEVLAPHLVRRDDHRRKAFILAREYEVLRRRGSP
jgi:hypothetical protein